ncbi:MAG: hypothetical protein Q8O42_09620 [Acidobacteriota bacterium]|nr:hypothetical protein [Acidobacteriota bacterium]
MSRVTRLQRAAEREAEMQEFAVQAFERQLDVLVARLLRRLRDELAEWDADASGRLVNEIANLGRALAFRKQFSEWLLEEGFLELAARVLADPLDELAESVFATSRIANEAAKLASFTDTLNALKELRLAELLDVSDDMARELSRITFEGILSLRPVDALVLDISDRMDISKRQARTIYDTAVSTYARQVELLNADGTDDELFVFVGPFDKKNRAFCEERVGKVFDRKAIDAMDNGQLPDVFISGGGYNCRHTWKRVSELDDELRELAKTGGRVPEIEALRAAA